jgi:hypothetical protein
MGDKSASPPRRAPAKRLIWLAVTVFSPLAYGAVMVVLSRTGYEEPFPDSPLLWLFLGASLALFIFLYISRSRWLHSLDRGQVFVIPFALAETIAVLGLLAYLLFGSLPEALILVVLAILTGWLVRPG